MTTPVPIVKLGDCIIAVLQAALSDTEILRLRDALAEKVGSLRARGVVIDVSALDVIDSFSCRTLRSIAQTNSLRGAETVIVGIQPDVAFAMVQLGLSVKDVKTLLDAEEAISYLARRTRKGS